LTKHFRLQKIQVHQKREKPFDSFAEMDLKYTELGSAIASTCCRVITYQKVTGDRWNQDILNLSMTDIIAGNDCKVFNDHLVIIKRS
jgi:hypothetical protein